MMETNQFTHRFETFKKVELFQDRIEISDGDKKIKVEKIERILALDFEIDQLFIRYIPIASHGEQQITLEKIERDIDVFIDRSNVLINN